MQSTESRLFFWFGQDSVLSLTAEMGVKEGLE